MPFLIGIDEAGYGPNLGPLVISATVWRIDELSPDIDLYKQLRAVVCKSPSRKHPQRRLAVADSKSLYKPPHGLALLERGVLAALAMLGDRPADWHQIWRVLDAQSASTLEMLPWHVNYQLNLPLQADAQELDGFCPRLQRGLAKAGVRLMKVASTAVFPEQFNFWTERYGTKGEALSRLTLALLATALESCSDEPVLAICDKHGGRNQYGRLLQEQFPDPLVEIHQESLAESTYRWGADERRVEVRFRAGGETFLPAALASMVSKYLRELAMRAFNEFWCCRVPDLQPTAGYPTDARRFKNAIQLMQAELGIDDRVLWRVR